MWADSNSDILEKPELDPNPIGGQRVLGVGVQSTEGFQDQDNLKLRLQHGDML